MASRHYCNTTTTTNKHYSIAKQSQGKDLIDSEMNRSEAALSILAFAMKYFIEVKSFPGTKNSVIPL